MNMQAATTGNTHCSCSCSYVHYTAVGAKQRRATHHHIEANRGGRWRRGRGGLPMMKLLDNKQTPQYAHTLLHSQTSTGLSRGATGRGHNHPSGHRHRNLQLYRHTDRRPRPLLPSQAPAPLPMPLTQQLHASSSSENISPLTRDKTSPLYSFWKFLRPHTIRGTILASFSVTIRALIESPGAINWMLVPRALLGVLCLLCGNGFIVGINQIYDTSIDKMNKPFLPVASGEISKNMAWLLCGLLAGVGVLISRACFGSLICTLYCFGLFLGTVYSVPPLRLKRYAVPSFLIIATVRGFLLNFGVFYAARAAMQLPFRWSPAIVFITVFSTIFATVIAITKDLPDVKGDQKYNINTFATRLGVEKVSAIGVLLLFANYIGAIVMSILLSNYGSHMNISNSGIVQNMFMSHKYNAVMITSHVLLAGSILNQWRIVNMVRIQISTINTQNIACTITPHL